MRQIHRNVAQVICGPLLLQARLTERLGLVLCDKFKFTAYGAQSWLKAKCWWTEF